MYNMRDNSTCLDVMPSSVRYMNINKFAIRNILFMAPRIKLIVIFNLLWSEFVDTFVSTNSFQSKFKNTINKFAVALFLFFHSDDLNMMPPSGE